MNIMLRPLKKQDAILMLEWMHDKKCQKGFKKNMLDMTLLDAERFCIDNSMYISDLSEGLSVHFAIVNDKDEYLGTISLKNISLIDENAEYAVVIRPSMQGKGIALNASKQLLEKAFLDYHLNKVYLTVLEDNKNAIKLYDKLGFKKEGLLRKHVVSEGQFKNWLLYGLLKDEYNE